MAPPQTPAPTPEKGMVTLTRYLLNNQELAHGAGDFTLLMSSIQLACKVVSSAVRQAGILGIQGMEGGTNVQGEAQQKLDVIADQAFIAALRSSGRAAVLVSEEQEEVRVSGLFFLVPRATDAVQAVLVGSGKYVVTFDPLDGSSNIDVNGERPPHGARLPPWRLTRPGTIGSIFGIYAREHPGAAPTPADALRPGTALVAAGYCIYGSATLMVLTFGHGVNIFCLDPAVGEFVLVNENARIPAKPQTIFSLNEGNARFYPKVRPGRRALPWCGLWPTHAPRSPCSTSSTTASSGWRSPTARATWAAWWRTCTAVRGGSRPVAWRRHSLTPARSPHLRRPLRVPGRQQEQVGEAAP